MKSILKVTAMACLLATTTSVIAAPAPLTLEIEGKIKPGACTPSFVGGGAVIDFGTLMSSETSNAEKMSTVKVSCTHYQKLAFNIIDMREDSQRISPENASGIRYFGLGTTVNSGTIGSYKIRIDRVIAYGESHALLTSDNGTSWRPKGNGYFTVDDGWMSIGLQNGQDDPVELIDFTFELHIKLEVDSYSFKRRGEEAIMDGAAVINFVYL